MEKTLKYAPAVTALTFLFEFILPKTWNFITFLLPVIYACVVYSRNGRGFNLYLFFFIMLAAVLIPTGFLTLDVSNNTIIPAQQPSFTLTTTAQFWINLVAIILSIVIPIAAIALIIGDLINPYSQNKNYGGAISTIVKFIIAIIFFFVGCIVFDLMGWLPNWFFWRYIRDFIIYILQILNYVGYSVVQFFTGGTNSMAFPTLTDLGGYNLTQIINGEAGTVLPAMNAVNPVPFGSIPWVCVNVSGAIPLVLATIVSITWFYARIGRDVYKPINKYCFGDKAEDLKIQLTKFNAPAAIFGSIILVYAFGIFLGYNNTGLDIGIYLAITVFCLILIIVGIIPIKTGSIFKVLEGILIGTGGVFFFYNLLTTGLSALEFNDANIWIRVLNQIFFVAPTESLIFHVVIPGLGLLATYYIYKHFKNKNRKTSLKDQILRLQLLQAQYRELYNQAITSNAKTITYKNRRFTISELSTRIFNLDNAVKVLELKEQQDSTISMNTLLFSKIQYLFLVIVLCFIIPNFVFSSYHSIRSGIPLLDFWTNGMGFVYLGSGCWLTFISIRYGWLPAIGAHALINILSIILMGVAV